MGRPQPAKNPRGQPPAAVMKEIRSRLSEREVQGLEALFTLRITAQQVDNARNEWMAGNRGIARTFQDPDGAVGDQREWHLAQGHRACDGCDARNRLRPHDSARKRRPREIPHGPGGSAETDRATDLKRRCSHQEGLRAQLSPISCGVRVSLVGRSDELDGYAPAGSREPCREAVETRTGRRQESSRNVDQRCHDLKAYLREVLSRVADIPSSRWRAASLDHPH